MAVKGDIPWNKGKTGTQSANKTSFKKGNVPWNKNIKGLHMSPSTEFKKGVNYNTKTRDLITKNCKYCKKEFKVKTYLDRVKFCSISCGALNRNLKGKNHPNWKGGRGTERHRAMNTKEYKLWRKSVFEKDNYTCVDCGARSMADDYVYLQADHIKPWSEFPELRYAIDNGRTLCIDCHEKTDSFPIQLRRRVLI